MFSIPAALVIGIVGIVYDKRKLVAIITTTIAAGLIGFYVFMTALSMAIC
ncbi:MAG: hypothetical protein ACYSSI_07765 [Planctomycetota bacterium]|jgi:hypothetical protein